MKGRGREVVSRGKQIADRSLRSGTWESEPRLKPICYAINWQASRKMTLRSIAAEKRSRPHRKVATEAESEALGPHRRNTDRGSRPGPTRGVIDGTQLPISGLYSSCQGATGKIW